MRSPFQITVADLVDLTGQLKQGSKNEFAHWLPPVNGGAVLIHKMPLRAFLAHRFVVDATNSAATTQAITLARPTTLPADAGLGAERIIQARHYTAFDPANPSANVSTSGYNAGTLTATHIDVNKTANTGGKIVVWYLPADAAELSIDIYGNDGGHTQARITYEDSVDALNILNPYEDGQQQYFSGPSVFVDGMQLRLSLDLPSYTDADALGDVALGSYVDLSTYHGVSVVNFKVMQVDLTELRRLAGPAFAGASLGQIRRSILSEL